MDRNKIVTNGCSGGCCERFTLPYSLKELEEMWMQAIAGEVVAVPLDQLRKIVPMLIPLGKTDTDPATGKSFSMVMGEGFLIDAFTCKHFDIENRICTDYENRPDICKQMGCSGCNYSGCSFKN